MPKMRGGLTLAHKELKTFIKETDQVVLSVGFLGDEQYPDGEEVGDVAAKNEFGEPSENVPPRPFMRPAILLIENNATDVIRRQMDSTMDIRMAFDMLGLYSVNEVQTAIKNVTSPPLAPLTILLRMTRGNFSNKPLEDTKRMINSVNYEVSEK